MVGEGWPGYISIILISELLRRINHIDNKE